MQKAVAFPRSSTPPPSTPKPSAQSPYVRSLHRVAYAHSAPWRISPDLPSSHPSIVISKTRPGVDISSSTTAVPAASRQPSAHARTVYAATSDLWRAHGLLRCNGRLGEMRGRSRRSPFLHRGRLLRVSCRSRRNFVVTACLHLWNPGTRCALSRLLVHCRCPFLSLAEPRWPSMPQSDQTEANSAPLQDKSASSTRKHLVRASKHRQASEQTFRTRCLASEGGTNVPASLTLSADRQPRFGSLP
ncbi:hypothetical protein EJ04DRAFT_26135 [Polyplosphaeria fusca]|uniref:Uncharacterized protein n=1 Tax=Polyplosphaeria fusca TaxID=682080 RepID=A0A9P4V6X7_9PLEO|nr:hypothetical protein EJ04DRAFT_26135 [Polyplosphaeria fusca]